MNQARAAKTPSWDYAVELYGREGVEAACLSLQERRGADVNLLLFCCWIGGAGRALRGDEIDSLVAAVAPWRAAVIEPLRAVRRGLKAPPDGAPNDAARVLRARIREDEIEAEAIEQAMLVAALGKRPAETSPPGKAMVANMARYLKALGAPPSDADLADAATIACAGCPDMRPLEALRLMEAAINPDPAG